MHEQKARIVAVSGNVVPLMPLLQSESGKLEGAKIWSEDGVSPRAIATIFRRKGEGFVVARRAGRADGDTRVRETIVCVATLPAGT